MAPLQPWLAWAISMVVHASSQDACPLGAGTRAEKTSQMGDLAQKLAEEARVKASQSNRSTVREDMSFLQKQLKAALALRNVPAQSTNTGTPLENTRLADFELCQAQAHRMAMGQEATHADTSLHEGSFVCGIGEVVLFSPTESPPYFQTECCPAGKDFCAGCARLNGGKTACEECTGGFMKLSGKCLACMDLPGWVNKADQSCTAAACSTEKFQGLSSEAACCKCGGHGLPK